MMLVTAREMRAIDRHAIDGLGIASLELMEAAGRRVADEAARLLRDLRGQAVVVIAGRGNNGGDGLVVARLLAQAGARVQVFIAGEGDRLSEDARTNLDRALAAGLAVYEIRDSGDTEDLVRLCAALAESVLVVDGLFGTGLTRPVAGVQATVIDLVNEQRRATDPGLRVLAIDVPSGIDADTGAVPGPAIQADVTVTLAFPKMGLYMHPARTHAGHISVVDIGIPVEAAEAVVGSVTELIDRDEARRSLPVRRPDAHKGDAGHVVIAAASPGLTGAATLAALGALRAGAGLVTVVVPRSLNAILEVKLTEAMTIPVTESAGGTHTPRSLDEIMPALEGKRALAVGPGLSRHPEAAAFARELVGRARLPVVLDADGLNAFAGDVASLRRHEAPLVLTPHPGEMARLLDVATRDVVRDRLETAAKVARQCECVVVLKGAPTVIADASGNVSVNSSGNAGLGTGGTGDVLTGAILGFLSQGLDASRAARLAVYLHGLAGDLLARRIGPIGYLASDVAAALPRAMRVTSRGPRRLEWRRQDRGC